MEGQRFVSKKVVSAYDDVFGGPPRFAAPFADYAEIFGGAGSVCSIPFLDLPPAMDGLEGDPDGARQDRGFDYAEVFGGSDFGEFAVPYEELFASSRRKVQVASSDGRFLDDPTIINEVTQESKISLGDMNEGHLACSEDGHDCFSSNSNHIERDPKQSNLSYTMTSPGSNDCALSMTDHITNRPEIASGIGMNEGHVAYVEDAHDCLASICNHSEHSAKQSNLSYNSTSPESKDGAMSRTMHITDPPGIGSIIDRSTSFEYQHSHAPITRVLDVKSDVKAESKVSSNLGVDELKSPGNKFPADLQSPASNIDHAPITTAVDVKSDLKQETQLPSNLSGDESKTPGNKFPADLESPASNIDHPPITRAVNVKSDLKLESQLPSNLSDDELKTPGNVFTADLQSPASNIDHANLNDHSHESGSNSIASDDIPTSSVMYISVSDISLQTQPLRVPPPSRPPPKIHIKKDHPILKTCTDSGTYHHGRSSSKPSENPQEDSGVMIFKSHARQDAAKVGPFISDVNVDANSAAAAMKEAMELAEAKLRSAKELMERKHVNFQNRKKLGHHENRSERKVDQSAVEICNTCVTPETLTKEEKQIDVIGSKESTWERIKVTTNISVNNCNEKTDVALASEFGSINNWREDKEKSDTGENSINLIDDNAEVVKELDNNVLVASPPQEGINDFENANVSGSGGEQHEEVENVHEGQLRVPFTIDKSTTSGRSEGNPLTSENHEFQMIDECKDGNRKQTEANEFCKNEANLHNFEPIHINSVEDLYSDSAKFSFESGDNEKDLAEANVNCEEHMNESNLNACIIHAIPDEEEMNVPFSSCVGEVGEELISGNLVGCSSANSILQEQVECDHKENLVQMDRNRATIVQETSEEMCLQQESSISRKSASGEEVNNIVKVADEVKEGLKKLKATETMMYGQPEKSKATEVSCLQYCNEVEEREVWVEEEKSKNMQEAAATAQVFFSPANTEKQNICQKNHEVRDNEEIREIHVKPDGSENIINISDTPVSSQLPYLNLQSEKRSGTAESAKVAAENFDVVSAKIISNIRKTEEKENEQMERVRIWTEIQARKLEKEKEREREREKDRLAMERETCEARERAFAEAKERADRIAVERVTAEARQRALKEAREKAEKASLADKSLAEKASREARLRSERAAVERATSEARERAAEKARAEKAAADARERTERSNGSYRDRISRENLTEEHFKARSKDVPSGAQFQSIGSSSSSKGYAALNSQKAGEGESALRCKARLERHQRTAERVAKALAEKNTRDILAQREQAERNRLSEYLDADVKRWSNGKEGNLRALLSTLQYILGPESGWQPICLTDVITAAAVKKAYRKATLCVHPDKLQQRRASIQQKYICEKVFDLLKEAWNKFNSEER